MIKPLRLAKMLVRETLLAGEVALDGTLGNGHDALFLAERVGETGKVIGFDVQEAAVANSTQRLFDAGVEEERFEFHACGHEKLNECFSGELGAAMFNLGFLPGSDREVITRRETSLSALAQALGCLKPRGILTVMCYPGHEGGDEESRAVLELAAGLDREKYQVTRYDELNSLTRTPFLVVVWKRKGVVR